MTIKKELVSLFSDEVKELTLKQIYILIPNTKKETIRAVLNQEIKKGDTFVRVSKSKYKLK